MEEAKTNTPKVYNLKNDIIFKTFFARKGNEEFLIDFLNALLQIEIDKIDIREEVNLEKLSETEKGGRLDLQARLNDNTIVNIELQMKDRGNMQIRTTFYAAKTLAREIRKGTDYDKIEKVIMISILGYNMFEKYEEYIHKSITVLEKHRECIINDSIQWWYIELPKFRKMHPDMDEKLNQWLAIIDDENKEWIEMAEKKNKTLKRAREELTYLTGEEAVRREAELREKWDLEWEASMKYAREQGAEFGTKLGIQEGRERGIQEGKELGIQEGKELGIQEGKELGIQEGRERGIQEGKEIGIEQGKKLGERKNKEETVKKMIELNIPIEQIIEISGLTEEEIKKLK